MPLIWGAAMSYSPLMYRPPERWPALSRALRGSVPQPAAAAAETADHLAKGVQLIGESIDRLRESLHRARIETLVLLVADRQRAFDDANFPQIHIHAGGPVWSDTSLANADEERCVKTHECDTHTAQLLIGELFDAGFEVAESHGDFAPVGASERGAVPALLEPLDRFGVGVPIVPVHLNCHVAPVLRGTRVHAFGTALGKACGHIPRRIGVLASGGLSGDPGGYLAGWIDPELDQWVLRQLETVRATKLAPMFDIESQALRGNSAEIRLWLAAAAAMEAAGALPGRPSYACLHAAAAGLGFLCWEDKTCQ